MTTQKSRINKVVKAKRCRIKKDATRYNGKDCADAVFKKATPIKGKNTKMWRLDGEGKVIKRTDLNSTTSQYAWNIDHIIPRTRGGSDDIENLQPLNRKDNIRFSNKLTDDKCNYNKRQHFNAILVKNGKKPIKMQKKILIKGSIVLARQSPTINSMWREAKIVEANKSKDYIELSWVDARYKEQIVYDDSLIELL
jgi:hypothetical protein